MAAPNLPPEVAEHLEAAVLLANKRLHLRYLEAAEVLLALSLPNAAVIVAGVELESILLSDRAPRSFEERLRMEKWLALRDRVAHATETAVGFDQAKEMIEAVRALLMREIPAVPRLARELPDAARELRGKYRFVPTSAAEFIRRKQEDLRLEDNGRGD
jgi:hypothetical protein